MPAPPTSPADPRANAQSEPNAAVPKRRGRGRPSRTDPPVLARITLPDGHFLNQELAGKTPLQVGEYMLEKTELWHAGQAAPKAPPVPASDSSRAQHIPPIGPQSNRAPVNAAVNRAEGVTGDQGAEYDITDDEVNALLNYG